MKNEKLISAKLKSINQNDSLKTSALVTLTHQQLDGPAARLEALKRLTASSSAIWWANWFVILLFIAVETAPVFVKLISPSGPYDQLLKAEENSVDASHLETIAQTHATTKNRNQTLSTTELNYLNERLDVRLNRS
jgi:hypothetical protein